MSKNMSAVALVAIVLGVLPTRSMTQERLFVPITHGPFHVQSHTGRCLTYGVWNQLPYPGEAPVTSSVALYIDDCNPVGDPFDSRDELLQRVVVREVNARHEIVLEAGGKVIGVRANDLRAGARLELQDYTGAAGQFWAFDGDSLILRANRDLVAEVRNARTPGGTPVVLGRRDLDDAEFWKFIAVDGTDRKPTSGFVRVPLETDLRSALKDASWGTVVEVHDSAWIRLDDCGHPGACPQPGVADFPLYVPAGVTLRGNRAATAPGPLLTMTTYPWNTFRVFEIAGSHARITGLRLSGPSPSKDGEPDPLSGIFVDSDVIRGTVVDHNEMLGWTEAAVHVKSYDDHNPATDFECVVVDPALRPHPVRVVRNFLHHNARKGLGYGVTIHSNGFAAIQGNTFLYNRHAIAADGLRGTGYSALFNLVLSDAPEYDWWGNTEHDFDMHGAEPNDDGHHVGGIAGSDVYIARNTFLGSNPDGPPTRYNYEVRGVPCGHHRFQHNVTIQTRSEAIHWYGQPSPTAPPPPWLETSPNKFNATNPTRRLAAGDFDGDGVHDLFLATGAAWYYSPAGVAEWRYRNDLTTPLQNLFFGDVDGDGRTDVLHKQLGSWFVYWAGGSIREKVNEREGETADFAIGDFDGDKRADIFYSTGSEWLVSYGATAPFVPLYPSTLRARDLRFGDFNGDGRTDVFAVIGEGWYMRSGGSAGWSLLRAALTESVDNLLVTDFNGDGRSDVAQSDSSTWRVSYGGAANWTTLRSSGFSLDDAVAIAPFDNVPGADVLAWELIPPVGDPRYLRIFSGGRVDSVRYSRWHMR